MEVAAWIFTDQYLLVQFQFSLQHGKRVMAKEKEWIKSYSEMCNFILDSIGNLKKKKSSQQGVVSDQLTYQVGNPIKLF